MCQLRPANRAKQNIMEFVIQFIKRIRMVDRVLHFFLLLHFFLKALQKFFIIALCELIRRLAEEAASGRPESELCTRGLFFQFLAELLRLVDARKPEAQEQEEPPLIADVLRYLGEHYREELSVDAVAERFYVSKFHLSHLFSRSVGTSMYRYILLKRLQRAKEMLAEGAATGDACRESGFQDYANFYRSFRSVYGVSPQNAVKQMK